MEKWTTLINESNKKEFVKQLVITLDNDVVLEAKITIKDINESMANDSLKTLINKSIKNIKIVENYEKEENIINSEPATNEEKEVEFYVPYSSIFHEIPYNTNKIIECLKNNPDIISIHTENQYGWNNQPEVVVVKVMCEDLNKIKHDLVNKLQHCLGTEWVRLSQKDWK